MEVSLRYPYVICISSRIQKKKCSGYSIIIRIYYDVLLNETHYRENTRTVMKI